MDGTMWLHSTRTKEIHHKLLKGDIGKVNSVHSCFTIKNYDPAKKYPEMEPMGVLGDLGWYPISAILFAFDYELPIEVKWSHNTVNPNDFLLSGSGFLRFTGDMFVYF
jgi:predicted dehydrogenase